jgi:phage repressor protein C with HTH and peptisase S24 domain
MPLADLVGEEQVDYRTVLIDRQHSPDIPVFGFGAAGEGIEIDDSGYPQGEGEFRIARSTNNRDPHAYATRVTGDSMVSRLWEGDVVEVRTDVEVRSGNLAVILHEDGKKWIKRVKLQPKKGTVLCISENRAYPPFELPLDKVRMHKIVGLKSAEML